MPFSHDPAAFAPMRSIVRLAVIVVTLALFMGSSFHAMTGQRDLAIIFALATPLGISAWGFARAGFNEPALVLLCTVMITLVTLVLILSPLGVHDVMITAYGGIVAVGALLLTRTRFYALAGFTLFAATFAFVLDLNGLSRSRIGALSGWPGLAEILVILVVFAVLGRYAAETLFGSLAQLHRASSGDPVTGLPNRAGFMRVAGTQLKALGTKSRAALVLADIDGFRRINVLIGHQAGDGVLREVASRVQAVTGSHLVARIGDDEFAVLAVGLIEEAEAEAFALSVHRALQFEFSGVTVRASVGFARYPRDANNIDALLLAAEGSLTRAKDHEHEATRFAGPADRI
jgi:diguanylate cyclase (GGDEF)-like protein